MLYPQRADKVFVAVKRRQTVQGVRCDEPQVLASCQAFAIIKVVPTIYNTFFFLLGFPVVGGSVKSQKFSPGLKLLIEA